jgi:hypothetical protein
VLLREYQGERHTVTVVANGYVWREATYASLSIIARINGTASNGPRFFGLRTDKEATVAADAAGASPGRRMGDILPERGTALRDEPSVGRAEAAPLRPSTISFPSQNDSMLKPIGFDILRKRSDLVLTHHWEQIGLRMHLLLV